MAKFDMGEFAKTLRGNVSSPDTGREEFCQVPCIREREAGSAALQELRLIYANSDTRKLTSAELSRQAERVEALLYQLKEEGLEFPGRMRDHVAEACQVSRSKLARLKVIRERLIPAYQGPYQAGRLKETSAYALASQPEEIQREVAALRKEKPEQLSEYAIKSTAAMVQKIRGRKCPAQPGVGCSHAGVVLEKIYENRNPYHPCEYNCCKDCDRLASCKTACPLLADLAKERELERREAKRQEKLAKEAEEAPKVLAVRHLWRRFGEARRQAGKTIEAAMESMGRTYWGKDAEIAEKENGTVSMTPSTALPYGYSMQLSDLQPLILAADTFGYSVDYLLCRTEEPQETGEPAWQTGTPPRSGLYYCKFSDEGVIFRQNARYDSVMEAFYFNGISAVLINFDCIGWCRCQWIEKARG